MDRASVDRASLVININRRLRDDWRVGTSQGGLAREATYDREGPV